MIDVYKLGDLQFKASYSCSPRQSVIAAYAQFDKKDFNTGNYNKKYGMMVVEHKDFVTCGDYNARKG